MDSAIWGLIGTLVGALASIGTTWLASKSNINLQIITKTHERAERSRSFQRDTLLDLQDAIHDALRLTTQGYILDRDAHLAGAEWGSNMLNDPLDENLRLVQRRVAILNERHSDDELRGTIKALMSLASKTLLSKNAADAKSCMQECYSAGNVALEAVGATLRSHY